MDLLRKDKIFLRLVEEEDLKKRTKWINDPEINEHLNFSYPISNAMTKMWFSNSIMNNTRLDFSIIFDEDYIGFCGILNIDLKSRKGELYCTIGDKDYWGKGIATSVYQMLIDYSFKVLKLEKLWACYNKNNIAAQKVFDKLQFQKEGLFLRDLVSKGVPIDRVRVALFNDIT